MHSFKATIRQSTAFLLEVNCWLFLLPLTASAETAASTYRHFEVEESAGRITGMVPTPDPVVPRWARNVSRAIAAAPTHAAPYFVAPIPFVIPPTDPGEPFYPHNHVPSITWLKNGDLLAIWYSTNSEKGNELTVLASRLRNGAEAWDPSSEFFKAARRNMHGSSLLLDRNGTLHHANGMAPAGANGWENLTLIHRTSKDLGVTWTAPKPAGPSYQRRQMVISGTRETREGYILQPCDADPGPQGGTALHISKDGGNTWTDPGQGKPAPDFKAGSSGQGTIAGIHAGVVVLTDGSLLAFGRGDSIDGRMPVSRSNDLGTTWTYAASPFPPIAGGQRLILMRLREGPLLFVSFTNTGVKKPRAGGGMEFKRAAGTSLIGHGMFAALSEDEGVTWPIRKLITPGAGEYDGGAWTGTFSAAPDNAEHGGYLASTQSPDNVIHLISSRLHYRFNLAWLKEPAQ